MNVYRVTAAPDQVAGWLRRLLRPACTATRLAAFPIELRPTGQWNGWASARDSAPDSRIALSGTVVLMHPHSIVVLFVHEACHQLLNLIDPQVPHAHDAAFLALQLTLLQRLDLAGDESRLPERVSSWRSTANLYDIQDPPESLSHEPLASWQPRAIAWAMRVADELATADLDAQACAREICSRYVDWRAQLQADEDAKLRALESRAQREQAQARDEARLIMKATAAGCVLLGAVIVTFAGWLAKH